MITDPAFDALKKGDYIVYREAYPAANGGPTLKVAHVAIAPERYAIDIKPEYKRVAVTSADEYDQGFILTQDKIIDQIGSHLLANPAFP
jgi:hypothetical protein